MLFTDTIQNFKNYALNNNNNTNANNTSNQAILETNPNTNHLDNNNDANNNKFNESLQNNIKNLIETAEQELECESLLANHKAHKTIKHKRDSNNNPDQDPNEYKCRHSNYSSNSVKKLNTSNANSLASSNNSNVYVDKNNPNFRKFSCNGTTSNNNNNNNIITTNSNSDNYNSNFTFNKVTSQPNLNTENSPLRKNSRVRKSYENANTQGSANKNNNLNSLTDPNSVNFEDENSENSNLLYGNNANLSNNFMLRNYFSKNNYAFILFELNNFCFTQKEYFKNIYPELNLVMVIELNDCVLSQEKIFFYRTNDDNSNNIYYPFLKKEDLKYHKYRIIKPIEMNDEEFPIKISISFFTYTNYKMLPIGSEEIFLTLKKEREMQKFNFYHNMHLKYVNKKVGNTFFNLAYKIEEIYPNQLIEEINNNLEILSVIFLMNNILINLFN